MILAMHLSAAHRWFIAALLAISGHIPLLQAEESQTQTFQETIAVLHMLYGSETRANHRYEAYAKTAIEEEHRDIAHMFKAIAASEAVHARNFKRILTDLGESVPQVDLSSVKSATTENNLKYASEIELAEIDVDYPRYIHRISPESHQETLKYINYAWETERQHRELIKETLSGTGIFFGVLLEQFKDKHERYYVHQHCGATVSELPLDECPICHKPLDNYREIHALKKEHNKKSTPSPD